MPRRRAWRFSCSRSRRRPSGSFFDVIPKAVDEYLDVCCQISAREEERAKLENPAWRRSLRQPTPRRIADQFWAAAEPCVAVSNAGGRRRRCGALSADIRPPRRRKSFLCLTSLSVMRSPIIGTSSGHRRFIGLPTTKEQRGLAGLGRAPGDGARRHQRRGVAKHGLTRSATPTHSSRYGPGSRRSTKCCSGNPKARASAASSSFWHRQPRAR